MTSSQHYFLDSFEREIWITVFASPKPGLWMTIWSKKKVPNFYTNFLIQTEEEGAVILTVRNKNTDELSHMEKNPSSPIHTRIITQEVS